MQKHIKVFSKTINCVFWKTAPNEDKNTQKKERKIIPKIKNIIYLMTKFLFSFIEISSAALTVFWFLIFNKFLSDKNIYFNAIKNILETGYAIDILGKK